MYCLEYHKILMLKPDSFPFFFSGSMGPVCTMDTQENFSITAKSSVMSLSASLLEPAPTMA